MIAPLVVGPAMFRVSLLDQDVKTWRIVLKKYVGCGSQ